MKFKQFLAGILAVGMILTSAVAAFADQNIDSTQHDKDGALGRYKYSTGDWGWIVEVYVATTEDGKLNEAKTLIDSSNAAYLGRTAFINMAGLGTDPAVASTKPFPKIQRPISIQNGGGQNPVFTYKIHWVDNAQSWGFTDPLNTNTATLKALFEVGQPALNNTWAELEKQYGGEIALINKVGSVLSEPIKAKAKATGNLSCLKPGNTLGIECPVEYAFVLTPIAYLKLNNKGYETPLNLNANFWIGANEGAVINRTSKPTAQAKLKKFEKENAHLAKTDAYKIAWSKLKQYADNGEMCEVANLTHRDLPDSAYLDHNQFGITTPQKYK